MEKQTTGMIKTKGFQIEYLDTLPDNIDKKVHQGHVADETAHGIVCSYKTFSLIINNSDGEAIGILTVYTAFSEIYVDDIWVDPNHRKAGLGRTLLDALENRFKGKGYNNINLVTSQFQAPDFYKKCGFEIEFIRHNKCNPKLTKTFFIKYFDDEVQNQGILK